MATLPPEGYEIVPAGDVNERIQAGDRLWDEEEAEWLPAARNEIGDYVSGFYAVARRVPTPPTKITPPTLRVGINNRPRPTRK